MAEEKKAEQLTIVIHSADECLPDPDRLVIAYGVIEGREDCGEDSFFAWYEHSDQLWYAAEFKQSVSVNRWFYLPLL